MLDGKKYKVLKVEGKDGLTVGSKVLKPDIIFTEDQWPYGREQLDAAIENKRCVLVEESKTKIKSTKLEGELK